MKKKKLALSFLIIGLIYVMLCGYTSVFDENASKVYDDAGLLEESEIEDLQKHCVSAAKQMKLDIGIVTTEDTQGKSTMAYADDFYDYNGFGYDQGYSGLIFLIDMQNREFYISTCGIAIQYFNDADIESILSALDEPMGNHDYYGAADTFIDKAVQHVRKINREYASEVDPWFEEDYTDYEDYKEAHDFDNERKVNILSNIFADIGIAMVVSAIIVLIMASGSKAKMTANANTYLNNNKLKIHHQSDIFLRTTVEKHKIESSDGGGHGGGSSHHSSSGRSHGGGGHSF